METVNNCNPNHICYEQEMDIFETPAKVDITRIKENEKFLN